MADDQNQDQQNQDNQQNQQNQDNQQNQQNQDNQQNQQNQDNQQNQQTNWRANLPEDMRSLPTLEKFKDESEMVSMPVNVARSYITAEQLIGRDKLVIPKTEEEFDAVYKQLGKPDNKELYVLHLDNDLDPKLKEHLSKNADWFRDKAFELGLSDKQATEFYSAYTDNAIANVKSVQDTGETEKLNNEIQLRTEFGAAYDGKMILAGRAMQELGGNELKQLIEATGVGNHPAFIRTFMKIGGMMAEDLGLDKNTGAILHSAETVKEQIGAIQTSAEYTDATNPNHKIAVNKVAALMQQIYGNKVIPPATRTY